MFAPGPSMSCEDYEGNSRLAADILIVYCWTDNFGYVIVDRDSKECAFVDATEDRKFERVLKERGLTLKYVLTTHHHNDHSAGNHYWRTNYKDVPVVCGSKEKVPNANMPVTDGQQLSLGNLIINCIHVPCHTAGHIAYHVTSEDSSKNPAVFTGDFLFYAGCGRFFEGNANDMSASINKLYEVIPDHTCEMFPGHEYAVSNLKFAISVLPDNQVVKNALAEAEERTANNTPNLGSTMDQERGHNPFIKAALDYSECVSEYSAPLNKSSSAVELVGALRKTKDSFVAK